MSQLIPQLAQLTYIVKLLTSPGMMVLMTVGFIGLIIVILWVLNEQFNKKIGWG